jgi:hypothetical protein
VAVAQEVSRHGTADCATADNHISHGVNVTTQ